MAKFELTFHTEKAGQVTVRVDAKNATQAESLGRDHIGKKINVYSGGAGWCVLISLDELVRRRCKKSRSPRYQMIDTAYEQYAEKCQ